MRAILRFPSRRKTVKAARIMAMAAMLHSSLLVAQERAGAGMVEELLLQVDVNQQQLDEVVPLLRDAGNEVYATARELARWRLRVPEAAALNRQGEQYYRLRAIAGLDYALDLSAQTLSVTAPADAFAPTTLAEAAQIPRAEKPAPGAFVNVDLLAQHAGGKTTQGGVLELGLFNPYGVVISDMLSSEIAGRRSQTRLSTTWTTDFPERLAGIRIGDAISRPGMWGRSLRFGGAQLATNFAVQPGLITMPMQGISGQTALPSPSMCT
jgi:outer membrane usher protein